MLHQYAQKLTLVALLFAFSTGARAQNTQALSLNDCIQYALDNHPDIKAAQLQLKDADWRIKENLATGLPQLSAGATYTGFLQRGGLPSSALGFGSSGPIDLSPVLTSFNASQVSELNEVFGSIFASDPDSKIFFNSVHSVSGNVSYNQLIFNNSYLVGLRAAKYYRQYVDFQLAVARQNVRNKVTDAYLPALLLSDNLGILDKNISNLEKLLTDTKAINQAGFAEQLDVDRLELSIATLRSERGNLARQQEIIVNALKFNMGMPIGEAISLT
ncbi:MAG: TolC family protein, partial [Saprospiraceae bacterium]|nr:TolC family protein [Saprospiraceae bacterium]